MVDIEEVKSSFRKFRNDFWEDITDINLERRETGLEEVKTKMVESEYFKVVQDFAKERGWNIESGDLKISAKKGEETVEIDLVSCTDESTLFVKPWSKVLERLKKLEELTED
ncbi:MAG TPA: hypothetical protein ENI14_02915 [Thermoplasmatales archaeon]|nr:hypothetical protein [Thermoplasmatales archaeon]